MTRIIQSLSQLRQMQLSSTAIRVIVILITLLVGWFLVKGCNRLFVNEVTKTYHIARKEVVYPVNLTGKERYLSVFSDDVMQAVAHVENIPVDITTVAYSDIYQALDNPHFDGVLTMRVPSIQNRSKFLLSDPFFVLGPVVVVRKDSTLKAVEDLKGRIVGVPSGISVANEVQKVPDIYIVTYDTYSIALENLVNNKVDAVVMDAWPAYVYLSGFYSDMLKVATPPINRDGLRLVVRNDPVGELLLERFNDGLREIRSNGTFKALIDRWSLIDTMNIQK